MIIGSEQIEALSENSEPTVVLPPPPPPPPPPHHLSPAGWTTGEILAVLECHFCDYVGVFNIIRHKYQRLNGDHSQGLDGDLPLMPS